MTATKPSGAAQEEKERGSLFKEIIAENFTNLGKETSHSGP